MLVSSQCLLPHLECLDPSEWSDQDDIEDTIDNELLSLSNHSLGKGKGTWVTKVAGPSVSCCTPSPGKAIRVFVGYQNCSLWTHLSEGKFFGY